MPTPFEGAPAAAVELGMLGLDRQAVAFRVQRRHVNSPAAPSNYALLPIVPLAAAIRFGAMAAAAGAPRQQRLLLLRLDAFAQPLGCSTSTDLTRANESYSAYL
ncbi:hypothetical protein [Paenibacillus sp. OV219]|uniref:hypothetical protein n=1 Tax=Paenibacillus sp. OV219 TaxID=1884377 RepID=UPI000B817DA7|nr:hypothetical protein [Paenibacillus sp. OV219]